MDWNIEGKYFERKPVTITCQIGYIFTKLWGKVLPSGMHPILQMLNFDDSREYQERATEYLHAPIHVADAPIIVESTDEEVVDLIDRYIICYLYGPEYNFEFCNLVKTLQTYSHLTSYLCKTAGAYNE